ncbi:uncharacterized protein LOC127438796 [Myxocyprinus asiaticus]|uniref:uncharacterized protein LOC127438796 n=1 Tax=Myxocyprinus asiaticus TaxID=70543 RepID=UPI002223D5F8|nr:uncharacterized protein LOC127438796 [Myxocyprinus asiaticus]
MKTAQLSLLYLLVCCQISGALTDELVVLGQNVTIVCEFHLKAIFWFKLNQPDAPVEIMRTFGSPKEPAYSNSKFSNKYSEGDLGCLFISHITADELGSYYCVKPGESLKLSKGIRVYTSGQNLTQHHTAYQILTVTFSLLSVVLFVAIIGLLKINHKLCKKSPVYENVELEQSYYTNGDEFSGVKFRVYDKGTTSSQTNSTSDPQPTKKPTYLHILPN